ncbi:MAG TPA: RNHCP domain-containing protein [Candidatus Paceibacterota bacterium]|nr:RNHCP domain-containing protein [Candidatus Paceibacterota bacterium]
MPKKFTKTIEDFICEHCGREVSGNGYTNHCPKCLWSKHVDKNPGDRLEACGGMMEPIKVEIEKNEHMITQRCVVCGFERRNRFQKGDDFDALIDLSKKLFAKIDRD